MLESRLDKVSNTDGPFVLHSHRIHIVQLVLEARRFVQHPGREMASKLGSHFQVNQLGEVPVQCPHPLSIWGQ